LKIELNTKILCIVWFSLISNGHHFSKTKSNKKHKHDVMIIEFMLWYQRRDVKTIVFIYNITKF